MMRKLALLSLFLLASFLRVEGALGQAGIIGPPNAFICNQVAQLAPGPTTLTQIVAPSTVGARIFVCGWQITNTGASGTFQLAYGTGTNCGTNTVNLTPVLSVGSTAVSDHSAYATMQTTGNAALCIAPSAATISGIVWFSQF